MKTHIGLSALIVLLTLVSVPAVLFGQEILTPDTYFNTVSATYQELQDYTADIVMKVDKDEMKGKLYFRKPNLLRIDFSVPEEQVIVSDGEKLTIYLPVYRVALVQALRKQSIASRAAMATREGLLLMKRNYHISFLKDPAPMPLQDGSSEMVVKLKLTWKSTEEGFRQIDLSIGQNGMIRRIVGITTGYKQVQMDYTNIRTNQNIPEGRFQYDPPPSASLMNDFLGFSSEN